MPSCPQRAAAIVRLLMDDAGVARGVSEGQRPAVAEAVVERVVRRRKRKLTPDVRTYILASRGVPPAELVTAIADKFGVALSVGLVYKTWRGQ